MGRIDKATISVKRYDHLPNVNKYPAKAVFDIPAHVAASSLYTFPGSSPYNLEVLTAPNGNTVSIHPARKFTMVSNYLDTTDNVGTKAKRHVIWSAFDFITNPESLKDHFPVGSIYENAVKNANLEPGLNPDIWEAVPIQKDTAVNEEADSGINPEPGFTGPPKPKDSTDNGQNSATSEEEQENLDPKTERLYKWGIEHKVVETDRVWGVQSEPELGGGVGFWLSVSTRKSKAEKMSDFVLIKMHSGSEVISLMFSARKNPMIIDEGAKNADGDPRTTVISHMPFWNKEPLLIGIMPALGRLDIHINGNRYLYNRTKIASALKNDGGEVSTGDETKDTSDSNIASEPFDFVPMTFKLDKIEVFGSSCMTTIGLNAMTFLKASFALPTSLDPTGNGGSGDWSGTGKTGVDNDNPSFAIMPGMIRGESSTGLCTTTYFQSGMAMDTKPEDAKYEAMCGHNLAATDSGSDSQGSSEGATIVVEFKSIEDNSSDSTNKDQDTKKSYSFHLVVSMFPGKAKFGKNDEATPKLNLIPCFYTRLRGVSRKDESEYSDSGVELAPYLKSFSENFSADDNSTISHTLDLVLYNKDGVNDAFKERNFGITLTINGLSFTGVTTDANAVEKPGDETITVHCEDYMTILAQSQLMNSPYYDGYDSFDVVQDILEYAGLTAVDDTSQTQRYYIPCGFSFLEPRYHIDSSTPMKNAIAEIAKLGEKIAWFDGEGVLHWSDLQGGIAYDLDTSPSYFFYKCPEGTGDDELILEQKAEEFVGSAPVNQIFLFSVDRTSNNFVIESDVAETYGIHVVPFRKALVLEQPAHGSQEAAKAWVNMIRERVYKVPRRITFKTVSTAPITPCRHFISVDGKRYRVKTVARSYGADDNSFTSTITGEWFGGGNDS